MGLGWVHGVLRAGCKMEPESLLWVIGVPEIGDGFEAADLNDVAERPGQEQLSGAEI